MLILMCVYFIDRRYIVFFFFFFKQKTAYEMRISDWSSDVCSSDLDKFGGCSVHIVTPGIDEGPVLAQTPVAIIPGDSVETLARRVQFAEHQLYPPTLAAFVTRERSPAYLRGRVRELAMALPEADEVVSHGDRKSTRLNSSH